MKKTIILKECKKLSENMFEIRFSRPGHFSFIPGQFIRFFHFGIERDYSIVSAPADRHLGICVRDTLSNGFSSVLVKSATGSEYSISGPHGYFLFQPSERPPVFIATGVGVAPFVSMARYGIKDFILLHGVQTEAELYEQELLFHSASIYIPCLSRVSESETAYFKGRVTEYVKNDLEKGIYDFYLCGHREMIREIMFLVDDYFSGSHVYSEAFY